MTRCVVSMFLFYAAAQAGVVQGTVQEYASGYALSRTVVRLVPVPRADNPHLRELQLRTAGVGQFVFFNVPDGYYFLISQRNGYFPGAYGQRRPDGQGAPILVTKDTDLFAQLRMHRKGAITGRVLDENGVGIEGVPVVAYRAHLPLRVIGQGTSDDRGVYRISGLDAGRYWVRNTSYTLDEGSGVLPTFGPQSREVREARAHEVRLDEDTPDADVHPEFGTLFSLGGDLQCPAGAVKVTLTSETMRRTTQGSCGQPYSFQGLSPAMYEISAENLNGKESGFVEVFADKTTSSVSVRLDPAVAVEFSPRKGFTIIGRRRDLYDAGAVESIPTPSAQLLAGHWEMSAQVGPDEYVESISSFARSRRGDLPDRSVEWFDVFLELHYSPTIRVKISDQAGHIGGTVLKDAAGVPGAPVFLWPMSESGRRSLKGYRTAIADTAGRYQFDGLPPGDYRMLATYDFTEIDEAALDEGLAATVHANPSEKVTKDLPLWVSP